FQTDLGFELRRVNCPFLSFRHFAVFPVQDYSLNHCLKSWIHYRQRAPLGLRQQHGVRSCILCMQSPCCRIFLYLGTQKR
ncbi:hypothetical protein, partial [Massilia sp. CCM 8734]|uniref:hypothetical protein n=1 Tax=Massilia sp. CCM 8734 TaxID=2609283 RepID=UPI001AAFEE54